MRGGKSEGSNFMIDWSRVNELKHEVGAEDFAEVVELFLEEVEENLGALTPGLAAPQLEQVLHALKGSALNLGFGEFAQLCQKGESVAAEGKVDGIDTGAVAQLFQMSKTAFLSGMDA